MAPPKSTSTAPPPTPKSTSTSTAPHPKSTSAAPNTKTISFMIDWNIPWSEFNKIESQPYGILKRFITTYKNIPYRWYVLLKKSVAPTKISFFLHYDHGPLEKIGAVEYEVNVVKNDDSVRFVTRVNPPHEADLKKGQGRAELDDNDPTALRTKYGLLESDPLIYRITLKLPTDVFVNCIQRPNSNPAPTHWFADLFALINDQQKSEHWDVKLISGEGVVFYCHKVISRKSKPLATLFSNPLKTGEATPTVAASKTAAKGTKRKASAMDESDEYPFENFSTISLRAMLEYLYTGKATLDDMPLAEVYATIDVAHQYELHPLKQMCVVKLWDMVVAKPDLAFAIAQVADLHDVNDDMKSLKDRAMDVIVENYELLKTKSEKLPIDRFEGARAGELRKELITYMTRRVMHS